MNYGKCKCPKRITILAKKNGDGSNSTGIRTIDLNGASPAVASALIPKTSLQETLIVY